MDGLQRNINLKHTQESYGIRKEALEFPMMCVIGLVYVCNAKCPSCPYTNSSIRSTYKDKLYMDEDTFKKIARQCGQYNAYIRITGGGEPMLHPQVLSFVEYAKKKKAKVGLITNGSLFTEDSLSRLIKAGIDMIEFSVDACSEAAYKKIRPGLDWGNLIRNVNEAVKIRNESESKTKVIASVINQKGIDVEASEEFWHKKVDKVQIRKFLTWGYIDDHSADSAPYLNPEEKIPCPWLFERLNIDTRGDVTICGEDIAFKEKFANVNVTSIKDIWRSQKFNYFREKHIARRGDTIDICRNCPDWKYRSWKYNYWKVEREAEKKRKEAV